MTQPVAAVSVTWAQLDSARQEAIRVAYLTGKYASLSDAARANAVTETSLRKVAGTGAEDWAALRRQMWGESLDVARARIQTTLLTTAHQQLSLLQSLLQVVSSRCALSIQYPDDENTLTRALAASSSVLREIKDVTAWLDTSLMERVGKKMGAQDGTLAADPMAVSGPGGGSAPFLQGGSMTRAQYFFAGLVQEGAKHWSAERREAVEAENAPPAEQLPAHPQTVPHQGNGNGVNPPS